MFNKKKYDKQYQFDNREEISRYKKQWRIDNPAKFAIIKKRRKYKQRSLGFYPLNEFFEGSEAHHISQNFIIYIPIEIHKSIPHNIWTGKNMEQINKIAVSFL